jgi:hypothetical protein
VAFYPTLGTGLAIYIAMTLEVISGFAKRFLLIKQMNHKTNQFILQVYYGIFLGDNFPCPYRFGHTLKSG